MVRRLLIVVLAPVMAVLVGLTAAGAYADQPPARPNPPPAICAEGELLPHSPRLTPQGQGFMFELEVPGWIKACPDADPDEVSRAALYWVVYKNSAGGYPSLSVEDFPAEFERVELRKRIRRAVVPLGPLLYGMPTAACMLTGPVTRIACFEVGPRDSAGVPQVRPIPIDHPKVARPVDVTTADSGDPGDGCPTCI